MTSKSNDLARLGLFSEGTYTSISDEYDKKTTLDSRYKGRQFGTSPPKKGKTQDVTFQKFEPLFDKEKYHNPDEEEKKYKTLMKSKNITNAAFKPSSPPKRSAGLGNYYGTIGNKYVHEKEYEYKQVVRNNDRPAVPRNILTSPPKRGTFGTPGTTIGVYSGKHGGTGVVGEYKYEGEQYDLARRLEQDTKKTMDTKRVTEKPFKPSSPPKKGTYGFPNTTISPAYASIPAGDAPLEQSGKRVNPDAALKPFRPSHPPRQGYNCTLSSFPAYSEDPLDKKIEKEKGLKDATKKLQVGPIFRPVSCPKSVRCPSIANHPLNRSIQH